MHIPELLVCFFSPDMCQALMGYIPKGQGVTRFKPVLKHMSQGLPGILGQRGRGKHTGADIAVDTDDT